VRRPDEDFQQFFQNGLVWRVQAGNLPRLREKIIPSLSQADQPSGFVLLKETDRRLILKSNPEDEQTAFIVKIFKRHPVKDGVKNLFRSPRSLKEWRVGLALMRKAIQAPIPIAAGVPQKFRFSGRDYFISEEIVGAQSLADWVEKQLFQRSMHFAEKRVLIRTLAAFVRTVHDSGVYSTDLHQGNILIEAGEGATPRFYLMDFHAIRFRNRLSFREKIHNLVQLNSFRFSTADRLRFLKHYCQKETSQDILTRDMAREIGVASERHWKELWRKRKGRALREGKGIERFEIGQWSGMIRKGWNSKEFQQVVKMDAFAASRFSGKKIKEGSRTIITELALTDLQEAESLVVKYYNAISIVSKLETVVRMSRARRAWIHAHQLVMRGIPTPTPIAFGEKKHWGIRQESMFLTKRIPEAQGSDVFLKEIPQQFTDQEREHLKKRFLVKLARLIRWMHLTGICHGDLKASNILVTVSEKELSIFLVDMDGMKVRNTLRAKEVAKDLSRLKAALAEVLSSSEFDYFLNIYGKGNRFFQTHQKRILETVDFLAAKKITQKQLVMSSQDVH